MNIREEKEEEFYKINELVEKAFKTAEVSDGKEQEFVLKLRKSNGYIKELALVAEDKNNLIGHIMLTKININSKNDDGKALLLAPVCIALEYRSKGIGSLIIAESLKKAKKLGYKSVFLVGNPEYYSRFGFIQTTNFGITNIDGIEDKYVQCLELEEGSLKDIKGTINLE